MYLKHKKSKIKSLKTLKIKKLVFFINNIIISWSIYNETMNI